MLDEYSIEQRATQIFDARTKEYFSEVLSCYAAGNYRSSVVMLWSVAVERARLVKTDALKALADARTLLEGLGEVSVDIQIVIREQE